MNFNPYVTEQLMKQQQAHIRKAARIGWVVTDYKTSKVSLFNRLTAKLTRKTAGNPTTVNASCCCATC